MTPPDDTMRDFFAGLTLIGLVMRMAPLSIERAAKLAYDYADAMLEAREVKTDG
jgi:hypothetical protein